MICSKCGAENKEGEAFCAKCGYSLKHTHNAPAQSVVVHNPNKTAFMRLLLLAAVAAVITFVLAYTLL